MGNLTSKSQTRGVGAQGVVTTRFPYDNLGRMTSKAYTVSADGIKTPGVTYSYDVHSPAIAGVTSYMTATDAVTLLIERFPTLRERVDDHNDLFEMPHVTYGLLATEVLEKSSDEALLNKVAQFVDELANSGDSLLEEFLVIDILEGIAQSPDVTMNLKLKITPKAVVLIERVEREYFGRSSQCS